VLWLVYLSANLFNLLLKAFLYSNPSKLINNMLVIHVVLGKANPERMNGVNKYVYQIATEQSKAGINVEVWGITKDIASEKPDSNFKIRLFKSSTIPFSLANNLKQALIELDVKNTFIHIHGGWIPAFASLSKLFKRLNLKYLFTPHGAYNNVAMQRNALVKRVYYHLFEYKVIGNAYKVCALGASELAGLSKLYPGAVQVLIPPGIMLPDLRTKECFKSRPFTISWCGRLDIYTKGLDILLSTFANLNDSGLEFKAILIGNGSGLSRLKKLIVEYKLENKVELCGSKFGEEKNSLIANSDLFVHPSRNEGLPTSVLEAAALGVPCMVSKETNIGEYINKNNAGWVLERNLPADWQIALVEAIDARKNEQLASIVIQARNMAEKEFAWPVVAQRLSEVYKSGLGIS
jgi:glycosyltransferase involved in cell wall biosynthesis